MEDTTYRTAIRPGLAYGAASLSGLLIAACFLRFQLFLLAWTAFVPLLWALRHAPDRRTAVKIGLIAGVTTNVPAFYWLVYTIHVFGGFPYPLAVIFYALLTLVTTQQFVLFALAMRRCGDGPLGLAAPLVWVSLEFLFPNLFPWRMAHTQFHWPVLLQVGDVTGPYGLSFVMLWVASGIVMAVDRPRRFVAVIGAAAAFALVWAYGTIRLPQVEAAMAQAPTVGVALVQGNVSIAEKGEVRSFDVNLDKYRELSEPIQDESDVVVWPETVNQRWISTDADQLTTKDDPFPNLRTRLIFGGLAYHFLNPKDAEEFNSAFLATGGGSIISRYDKRILMPFGEYIPGGEYFPGIYSLSPETGHFTSGRGPVVFDIAGKAKIGQLICYEDIVSNMPRQTTQAGAEILLNILNDAWYGDSAAPYQHQALALWRTVENRRYLLRGSNSGVTSIIDAAGRVVAQGGLFTAEVVRGRVPRLHIETLYSRVGDLFAWLVVCAALVLLWRPARRRGLEGR